MRSVTLIDQGGTQNASPGSLAAYGRKVWVVGGYSSGGGVQLAQLVRRRRCDVG